MANVQIFEEAVGVSEPPSIYIDIDSISYTACAAIQSKIKGFYLEESIRHSDLSEQSVINPFDLNAYKNRVMVEPALIEEADHILKMWVAIFKKYLPYVQEAILLETLAQGDDRKDYQEAAEEKAFDIMRAFLPLGISTKITCITSLREIGNDLTSLFFHPEIEVRDIAETIWKLLQKKYHGKFDPLDSVLLDLRNNYLSESGSTDHYYMDSPALLNITSRSSTEDVLNIDHPKRFRMSQEKAGYLRYNLKTFDMVSMYDSLSHLDAFWILSDRPRYIDVPEWFAKFGTISMDYVLDFANFREIQCYKSVCCPTPLINFKDITIHSWYLAQLQHLLSDMPTMSDFNSVFHEFENDLNCQLERIIDLTEHTPIQNGVGWLVNSQYLMPLGAMCLCTGSYSLPDIIKWAESKNELDTNPILRSIAINTCKFLAQTFNSLTVYLDSKRGNLT